MKTFKWFQDTFPQAKLTAVNAAIGGTGSDLGALRCAVDVIAQRPDLVFVEFNINDGSPANEFRKATAPLLRSDSLPPCRPFWSPAMRRPSAVRSKLSSVAPT